jgi:hypothetical protein
MRYDIQSSMISPQYLALLWEPRMIYRGIPGLGCDLRCVLRNVHFPRKVPTHPAWGSGSTKNWRRSSHRASLTGYSNRFPCHIAATQLTDHQIPEMMARVPYGPQGGWQPGMDNPPHCSHLTCRQGLECLRHPAQIHLDQKFASQSVLPRGMEHDSGPRRPVQHLH